MNERPYLLRALSVVTAVMLLGGLLGGCEAPERDSEMLARFMQTPRSPISGVNYKVLPPDVLSVQSRFVPEIHDVVQQVRPDGMVNLPLVGEIYVAGLTPREIEQQIIKAAGRYYEDADATISVAQYNSQRIYVFGQVSAPGPQQWTGTNTLLDVLARSQPTNLAWPERIRLVRGQSPKRGGYLTAEDQEQLARVVNDGLVPVEAVPADEGSRSDVATNGWVEEPMVMEINLKKMVETGDLSQNVLLQPDDVVYVPANPLAAVGLTIQQLLFPIRPAVETIRTPATISGSTDLIP